MTAVTGYYYWCMKGLKPMRSVGLFFSPHLFLQLISLCKRSQEAASLRISADRSKGVGSTGSKICGAKSDILKQRGRSKFHNVRKYLRTPL